MSDLINIVVPAVRHNMTQQFMPNTHWPVVAVTYNDPVLGVEWRSVGATVLECNKRSFSEKCNYAYENTTADWLLFTGEDVKFHKDWYKTLGVYMEKYKVIGTNDLLYADKLEPVHLIVSREYIKNLGGSWDGPNKVFHEYKHHGPDTEMIRLAQKRKVWGYDRECIVEHIHYNNGKALKDEVYNYATQTHPQDRQEYFKRLAQNKDKT